MQPHCLQLINRFLGVFNRLAVDDCDSSDVTFDDPDVSSDDSTFWGSRVTDDKPEVPASHARTHTHTQTLTLTLTHMRARTHTHTRMHMHTNTH